MGMIQKILNKATCEKLAVEATGKELIKSVRLGGNSALTEVLVLCIVSVYDYLYK